jgi:hypothetical protein
MYYESLGPLAEEYFDRCKRRHPVWKSESEYKAFLIDYTGTDGSISHDFQNSMSALAKYIQGSRIKRIA